MTTATPAQVARDYEKQARELLGTLQQKGFLDDEVFEHPAFDDSVIVGIVSDALGATAKSAREAERAAVWQKAIEIVSGAKNHNAAVSALEATAAQQDVAEPEQ